MNEIYQLIELLSDREKVSFTNYLFQRNKRKESKNVILFKAFLSGKENTLRKKLGDNAFNVAKKRLSDNLLDFIASRTLETEATLESKVIKLLVIARKLFHYEKNQLAFKILGKAQKLAESIGHYILLNEVFHLFIQYSHQSQQIDQNQLFHSFNNNIALLLAAEKRNMIIAQLKKSFKELEKQDYSIEEVLNNYKESIESISLENIQFKDLLQLAEITDSFGMYHKNYAAINLFFVDRLKELQGSNSDNEFQLVYHLELLALIANIYLRQKQFKDSIKYLSQLENHSERYQSKYKKHFKAQYVTLMALNLNFIGEHKKASVLLDKLLNESGYSTEDFLNPILARIMIHFQQAELESAKRLYAKLQESDNYYLQHKGIEWLLNKKFMEILLHIELGNIDLADSRIHSLIRTHRNYFERNEQFQIIPFLKLVKELYRNPLKINRSEFQQKVEQTIKWKPKEEEDLFLMCFYAWLKSKLENTSLYSTTLQVIQT